MAVPTNQSVPTITGTIEVGESLIASTGTWTGTPDSYAFQWYRVNDNTVAISGATTSSYVVSAEDTGHGLSVGVIATNNTGASAEAVSATSIDVPADWFIVEDGTGLADAVSLASLADADLYHGQRANTSWQALTAGQKKRALVRATSYIGQKYRSRFLGYRINATQALEFPRNWVEQSDFAYTTTNAYQAVSGTYYYPSDEVPKEVKDAACELALSSLSDTLLAEQGQVVKREKIGPLEFEYDAYSFQGRRFPVVDGLLAPFLESRSIGIRT